MPGQGFDLEVVEIGCTMKHLPLIASTGDYFLFPGDGYAANLYVRSEHRNGRMQNALGAGGPSAHRSRPT